MNKELNTMCANCAKCGTECPGTTNKVWTGCIYRVDRRAKDEGKK